MPLITCRPASGMTPCNQATEDYDYTHWNPAQISENDTNGIADNIFKPIFLHENWRILIRMALNYIPDGTLAMKYGLFQAVVMAWWIEMYWIKWLDF